MTHMWTDVAKYQIAKTSRTNIQAKSIASIAALNMQKCTSADRYVCVCVLVSVWEYLCEGPGQTAC